MMFPKLSSIPFLDHFPKGEVNQISVSVAIRNLALGLITIFVPIYVYQYFHSIPLTLLFFAARMGLFGLLIPFGGQLMTKIGVKRTMTLSYPFIWGFYLSLFFFEKSILFVVLAIILSVLNGIFFWPAYHTVFARYAERKKLGQEIGKINFAGALPGVLAPTAGGAIIVSLGYPLLFIIVLFLLFASAIPLFLSKEIHQIYTDSYFKAYRRIYKPENKYHNLAFAATGMEGVINGYLWPLFLVSLAIGYISIGGITTVAALISLLFILYMGRITDRISKTKLLSIGSILSSLAWIGKFFVINPISAFISHSFYRFSRTAASIPFQAIWYEKAKNKGPEIDEFIVYRDIVLGLSRCFFLLALAGLFLIISQLNFAFIFGAIFCLGFMFLGKKLTPPRSSLRKIRQVTDSTL